MADSSENDGPRRPATRPFVSGRPVERIEPTSSTYVPLRPFSLAGARTRTGAGATTTASTMIDPRNATPTPRWTVAVYEPGLERTVPADSKEPAPFAPIAASAYKSSTPPTSADDIVEASLALAEGVVEAQRHASSLAAADVLEVVASKLRRGEILLLPGASAKTDTSVLSSVLAALLGGRR